MPRCTPDAVSVIETVGCACAAAAIRKSRALRRQGEQTTVHEVVEGVGDRQGPSGLDRNA